MTAKVVHPRDQWEWFGSPAHFICGDDCRFHMATLVGPWVVSTVGEWLPDSSSWHIYAGSIGVELEGRGDARRADFLNKVGYIEIGSGRAYETMVFEAGKRCDVGGCGCGMPSISGSELDFDGYNDAGAATRGHNEMCEKWSRLTSPDELEENT
jgi:hypothetical protein